MSREFLPQQPQNMWESLYINHYSRLVGLASHICHSPEDAVQNAFEYMFVNQERINWDDKPIAYLNKIVKSRAIDERRKEARRDAQPLVLVLDNGEEVEGVVKDTQRSIEEEVILKEGVEEVFNKVSDTCKSSMELYMRGYSYRQAAEVLGVPRSTIASRMRNAQVQIRERLRL